MHVIVKPGSSLLRKYVPHGQRVELEAPLTVKDLLGKLGIPEGLVAAVVINGEKTGKTHLLRGGEEIVLIPPIAGG